MFFIDDKINPTHTETWKKLQEHFKEMKSVHMKDLFEKDKERFSKFSLTFKDILVDFSKNIITSKTLKLLLELAKEINIKKAVEQMFTGEKINETENRPVLHTALRNRSNKPVLVGGIDVMPKINVVLQKIETFSDKITTGQWLGFAGKAITDIVNIGIGGSNLGPLMVTEALKPYKKININTHFVSNVDGSHIVETLKYLNPETTLFLIASKTFTTQETMTNAYTARKWFLNSAQNEDFIKQHFIAISTNEEEVINFGIDPQNIFVFWDWVGGRYSLWSAIGLSIACSIGYENFIELLEGAHEMDIHFYETPYKENIPVILALIGIWYNNFFAAESEAILPYDQYLHKFPAYFQQGNMESNGKSVDRNGKKVKYQTGPIIWGESGTDGQHAFYQLIHQGTKMIPCDFLAATLSHNPIGDHHQKLLANFFAQTEALMKGKTKEEVIEELKAAGKTEKEIKKLLPFKIFEGNKPSNSILYKKLTPRTLGSLINILSELENKQKIKLHDSSTNGLIGTYKKMRRSVPKSHPFDIEQIVSPEFGKTPEWGPPTLVELHQKILAACAARPLSSKEIAEYLHRTGKSGNLKRAVVSLRTKKLLVYTIPDKPGSSNQRYRITRKGMRVLEQYNKRNKTLLNRLQIIKGDITTLKVDAIVNAANTSLLGGGGVDGAIHRVAGVELQQECSKLGGCPTGKAKITKGFLLPAKNVIHTVGPVWHGGKSKEDKLLASCYKNSLELAVKNNIFTIAFPAISTGVYRFPIERAAMIAIQEIKNFLNANSLMQKIILVCFNDEIYQAYLKAIKEIF
jgi:glucose-6-phosphate isomerase